MSRTPLQQLNRALLRALMSTDAASIVADRLEELERENAVLRAALERITLYRAYNGDTWPADQARAALEAKP